MYDRRNLNSSGGKTTESIHSNHKSDVLHFLFGFEITRLFISVEAGMKHAERQIYCLYALSLVLLYSYINTTSGW